MPFLPNLLANIPGTWPGIGDMQNTPAEYLSCWGMWPWGQAHTPDTGEGAPMAALWPVPSGKASTQPLWGLVSCLQSELRILPFQTGTSERSPLIKSLSSKCTRGITLKLSTVPHVLALPPYGGRARVASPRRGTESLWLRRCQSLLLGKGALAALGETVPLRMYHPTRQW